LRSFLACGHRVELFLYEDVEGCPKGVTIRDANSIIPESDIFYYRKNGSVAGFSNWFRYKMLFEEGGIWVDTDVMCLKRFDFQSALVFGKEEHSRINNAVLGGERGHPLFAFMMKQASSPNSPFPVDSPRVRRRKFVRKYFQGDERGNVRWGEAGPVGLTRAIRHLGLEHYALPYKAFYPVHSRCWDAVFDESYPAVDDYFPDSYAIHLWNEMMRQDSGFDKNARFPEGSLIEVLKRRYRESKTKPTFVANASAASTRA
jgi:hypothetical protein